MMTERTASITFVRVLTDALRAASADVAAVFREVGLATEMLSDPQARIPLGVARQAWEVGGRLSGDPDFGLNVVHRLTGSTFDLIEYLGRACDTVEDALENVARYARLVSDASAISLEVRGDEALFIHREPGAPRHFVELFFATIVVQLRELAQFEEGLVRVRFQHEAPRSTEAHARIFRAPVQFAAPEGALVFASSVLEMPLRTADPGLRTILARHATDVLARTPAPEDFVAMVERAVEDTVAARRDPDIDEVARVLVSSRRTLQRRMHENGTTFQEIVDRVRRELALHLFGDRRLPPSEVAWVVGFRDVTAFHRAFKRWTGSTPGAYLALRSTERMSAPEAGP